MVEDFLRARAEEGAGAKALAGYHAAWNDLASWYRRESGSELDPSAISRLDLAEWRRDLQTRLRPSTVNLRVRQVRGILTWAASEGLVRENPAKGLRSVPEGEATIRTLSRRTVAAVLREARHSPRDTALITLLAQTGLRISEALALTWGDVEIRERSGQVVVRQGKGGKRRAVPLNLTARQALASWREAQGETPGLVFPVTARGFEKALTRYARRARVEGKVTPHMFRHTFAKGLVDAGVSLDRVAALAGHSSLNTTARYTKPTARDLEQAVDKLDWT